MEKGALGALIQRFPFIADLQSQVAAQGAFPAGHYYSPIPTRTEVEEYLSRRSPTPTEVAGVDLRPEAQRALLESFARLYPEIPFGESPQPNLRYFYENDWFSYGDAIFLHSFIRTFKPARVIEVGSGFSSAVMLDTFDKFFTSSPELTCIEPYPERLNSLLKAGDIDRVRLLEQCVQDVPLEVFEKLQAGDLLFIDSSHVLKCGSDLHHIMFEVLPRLKAGVFVHFHDVFFPFEYPAEWLREGRYWNEDYVLRAFLSYNSKWEVTFFNTFVAARFRDVLSEKMPLCLRNAGGSLYLRRLD